MAGRIRLNGNQTKLPEEVWSFLSAVYEQTLERNRRMLDQLTEAVRVLNHFAITPILLKGIAARFSLGESAYPGRILSDLDLMVPYSVRNRAIHCLEQIGYTPHGLVSGSRYPVTLCRADDVGMIDLHFQLKTSRPYYDFGGIEPNCVPISIGGRTALLPSPTFQVLVLILHDQLQDRDYWRGHIDLRHLLDIEALAQSSESIDWDLLASQFPEGYPQAALQTQLLTIRNLLGISIPRHLTGGWWPRVQYQRRIVQANWPSLTRALTYLTLALDFPSTRRTADGGGEADQPQAIDNRRSRFRRKLNGIRRFQRQKALGKI